MCVHVLCAEQLPHEALVWVDRQQNHILVYTDSRLTSAGSLTGAGVAQVNQALAAIPGAPSLESAKSCQ